MEGKLKVVVRRLPPVLTKQTFTETLPENLQVNWQYWVQGKPAKTPAKEHCHSTAYLSFQNTESLLEFYKAYNNHLFIDGKGHESHAIVELAPYQKIPKPRRKVDPLLNTIEGDPDYLAYLESLKPAVASAEDTPTTQSSGTQLEKLEKKLTSLSLIEKPAVTETSTLLEQLRAHKKQALKASRPTIKQVMNPDKTNTGKGRKDKKKPRGDKPKLSKQEREAKKNIEKSRSSSAADGIVIAEGKKSAGRNSTTTTKIGDGIRVSITKNLNAINSSAIPSSAGGQQQTEDKGAKKKKRAPRNRKVGGGIGTGDKRDQAAVALLTKKTEASFPSLASSSKIDNR